MKRLITILLLILCSFLASLVVSALSHVVAHAENVNVYIVKKGDTLWKISRAHFIGLQEVIDTNPQFENPNLIYPNDVVYLPSLTIANNMEENVLALVNEARGNNGLPPLKMDWEVGKVARTKSLDMIHYNYFAHTSPNYGTPFQMLRAYDIPFRNAGENIASGQATPHAVVEAWLASEGHRKNIMGNYTHTGIGYVQGGKTGHYWTQLFISK